MRFAFLIQTKYDAVTLSDVTPILRDHTKHIASRHGYLLYSGHRSIIRKYYFGFYLDEKRITKEPCRGAQNRIDRPVSLPIKC